MDTQSAADIAAAFLRQHAQANSFWTPAEVLSAAEEDEDDDGSTMVLVPTRIEPLPSDPAVLWISWTCGVVIDVDRLQTVNRPEQRARVEAAIDALRAAHPELSGVRAKIELGSIDGGAGPTWTVTL